MTVVGFAWRVAILKIVRTAQRFRSSRTFTKYVIDYSIYMMSIKKQLLNLGSMIKNSFSKHTRQLLHKKSGWVRRLTWRRIFRIVAWGAAGIVALSLLFVGYLYITLPNINALVNAAPMKQSTKIYDRTGKVLLYEINGNQKRTVVSLSDIPLDCQHATIAVEDKTFYTNSGLDFRSILRSMWVDLSGGILAQGGSTITQQFVKNAYLTSQRSFTRKIREAFLALELDRKLPKSQILSLYLNEIPYGSNAYGIEAASEMYFGKPVKSLDLAECSILASLPQAPTYYSPFGSNRSALIDRQHLVLSLMQQQGYITAAQEQQADNEQLVFASPESDNIKAPHFVMYIKNYLVQKYGENMVENGGLKVTTTLSWPLQQIADKAVADHATANAKYYNASNEGLLAMDPNTGQILAMVGSRNYFDVNNDGNFNVTLADRQPGSSFKPIVYAEAFTKGLSPNTVVFDTQTNFSVGGQDYIPQDYDGKFRGPVTLRQALAESLNIPAVKVLYIAGINNAISLASKMGITTFKDPSQYGLSLVLGGGDVQLIQMVDAYGAFATGGIHYPTSGILEVQDSTGKILEQWHADPTRVLDANITNEISSVLSDNNARAPMFGANSALYIPGYQVAAKTGTTDNFRDGWTIGYTPSIVAGVWAGNNNFSIPMKWGSDGVVVAGPIWHEFMQQALPLYPKQTFTPPHIPSSGRPMVNGEWLVKTTVPINGQNGLLATTSTPPLFVEDKTYVEVHNILYYINKDAITGPQPSNPTQDPQFYNWEQPVQQWVQQHADQFAGMAVNQPVPTQYDGNGQPLSGSGGSGGQSSPTTPTSQSTTISASITLPQQNATITQSTVTVTTAITPANDVKQVGFFFDGALVGTSMAYPYSATFSIPAVAANESGQHTISIRVYGNDNTIATAAQTIVTNIPGLVSPALTLAAPNSSSFPLTLSATAQDVNAAQVNSVDFYYYPAGKKDQIHPIGEAVSLSSQNTYDVSWQESPGTGNYVVYAVMNLADGSQVQSNEEDISVQ